MGKCDARSCDECGKNSRCGTLGCLGLALAVMVALVVVALAAMVM